MHDRTTDLARFGVCAADDSSDDLAPARGVFGWGLICAGLAIVILWAVL